MKRLILKVLIAVILSVLLAPLLALAAYDVWMFQPQVPTMRRILADADAAEKSPPEALVRALLASHRSNCADARVLRDLFHPSSEHVSNTRLQFGDEARCLLMRLHFVEADRLTLFLTLTPMGKGVSGFAQASSTWLNVPLGAVSLDQSARLVTISKAPSAYLGNPERLAKSATALVERIRQTP